MDTLGTTTTSGMNTMAKHKLQLEHSNPHS